MGLVDGRAMECECQSGTIGDAGGVEALYVDPPVSLKYERNVKQEGGCPTKEGFVMLTSIIRAPGEMLRHVKGYGFLVALTGVHGFLYLLNGDIFAVFTEGNWGDVLYSNDVLTPLRALGLILASLVFSFYSLGYVSRSIRPNENIGKNSLFVSSVTLSLILFAIAAGLWMVMSTIISFSSSGGIIGLLATIFSAVISLLLILCAVKFSFAPVYMGQGLLPKDALSQSWTATRGKLFSTIIILFATLIVVGFIQTAMSIVTDPIEDESILQIILFFGSALGIFYSGTVLALAAPALSGVTTVLRKHRKK